MATAEVGRPVDARAEPASPGWRDVAGPPERRTLDGIVVPLLGTPGSEPLGPPLGLPTHTRPWLVRSAVREPDSARAAAIAAEEVSGGATSLWPIVVGDGPRRADLGRVLADVDLAAVSVVPQPPRDPALRTATPRAFATVLTRLGVRPAAGTSLGADPVGALLESPHSRAERGVSDEIRRTADLAGGLGVLGFCVDATSVGALGAGAVGELGYALAAAATYLRLLDRAGTPPARAAGLLELRLSVGPELVAGIASLRAARAAWRRFVELCGAPEATVRLHAVTVPAMYTRYEPWTNVVRGAIAAFAAGVGGADAVTVLPMDTATGGDSATSRLARRLARNCSTVAQLEAHLSDTPDPAGGAHAIEQLTASIAAAAWAEFQRIERDGGLLDPGARSAVRERAAEVGARRTAAIAGRERLVVGVSAFCDPGHPPTGGKPSSGWAASFEDLRDRPTEVGVRIVPVGAPSAQQHADAVDLLTSGGIRIDEAATAVVAVAGREPADAAEGILPVAVVGGAPAPGALRLGGEGDQLAALRALRAMLSEVAR